MNVLVTFTTVNSGSQMTVPFSSISHIIEHKDVRSLEGENEMTCWIHFHSGKSVHVSEDYQTVHEDMEEYFRDR